MRCRLPAEWEAQSGVLLAWPDDHTDWAPRLAETQREYTGVLTAITRHQIACVIIRDRARLDPHRAMLRDAGVRLGRLRVAVADYDDTWVRDYGPLAIQTGEGATLVDFRFDGWGDKFDASRDDTVTGQLHRAGCFGDFPLRHHPKVLEGGAIDVDGRGTLLTTVRCWQARHPALSREACETLLARQLGIKRVHWLEHGHLEGDDTDAHVDMLARFLDPETIAYQACDDPDDPHFETLAALRKELSTLRTPENKPYRLVPLPWPGRLIHDGRILPASYVNFLFVNGALLVPAYGAASDETALEALRRALPGRETLPVPSRTLIWQNGGLHCATMQVPKPVALNGTE